MGARCPRRQQARTSKQLFCQGLVARFFYALEMGWGEVRKQSKNTIQSLQMSARMGSLRQGDVLVSLLYSPSHVGSSDYLPETGHYVCL